MWTAVIPKHLQAVEELSSVKLPTIQLYLQKRESLKLKCHTITKIALSYRKTRYIAPFMGDLDLGAAVCVAMVIPSSFNREGTLSTPF